MKMIYAEYAKFILDHVKFRNSMIKTYSNQHVLDWQKKEIEKLDAFLIEHLEIIEKMIVEENTDEKSEKEIA